MAGIQNHWRQLPVPLYSYSREELQGQLHTGTADKKKKNVLFGKNIGDALKAHVNGNNLSVQWLA